MPKFFVDQSQVTSQEIEIVGEDVNHIKNVMRMHLGDEITINDRQGHDYECIINSINVDRIKCTINKVTTSQNEPLVHTCLFQSLVKGEKMDFIIQKSVEIGVSNIIPIFTERCVVKIDDKKRLESKIGRWNKIAESAAKQSGRGIVPTVSIPLSFEKAIKYASENLGKSCIPYEKENNIKLRSFLKSNICSSIGIFIGPEGGFTEEEIKLAVSYNIEPVTLGKRILRSETAGIVVLSNIMYEAGEM